MLRLLFEKTGNAIFISHLDLMRLFQRAFQRAGLHLKHTQGFNPRPSVSIALPLSVGIESYCELLDFELDGQQVPCEQILQELNQVLVSGIRVLKVYDNGAKLKTLSLLKSSLRLEYDSGVPQNAVQAITELFQRNQVLVPKKTKNGMQEQDLIPMIRSLCVTQQDSQTLILTVLGCCQNPTLNPMQLHSAITLFLPELTPDFVFCSRLEVYDENESIFR